MAETVRIGAVACQAVADAVEDNLAVAGHWTGRAAAAGAKLLLFPELSITGYGTRGAAPEPLTPGHAAIAVMKRLAAKHGMALAAGMAWRDTDGGEQYLAHGLWLPDGAVHIYRKTHLGQRERSEYAAGNELPVFRLPRFTVGIQMCLEQHFPEITQTLVLKGAQIILCPHATPRLDAAQRRESWHISLRARAYDNCCYIVAANQAGDNGQGTRYHGGALIADPSGRVVGEDFSGQAALVVAEIDLGKVVDVRKTPEGMCRRYYAPERRQELYI